jgi:hypothetical protein
MIKFLLFALSYYKREVDIRTINPEEFLQLFKMGLNVELCTEKNKS